MYYLFSTCSARCSHGCLLHASSTKRVGHSRCSFFICSAWCPHGCLCTHSVQNGLVIVQTSTSTLYIVYIKRLSLSPFSCHFRPPTVIGLATVMHIESDKRYTSRLDNKVDQLDDEEIDQLEDDTSVIPIDQSAAIPYHGQAADINSSHTPIVAVNKEGWPFWIRDWFGVFTSKNFGLVWISLVVKWTEVERSYKWASPVSDRYRILPGYWDWSQFCVEHWIQDKESPCSSKILDFSRASHTALSPTPNKISRVIRHRILALVGRNKPALEKEGRRWSTDIRWGWAVGRTPATWKEWSAKRTGVSYMVARCYWNGK